jgi:NAD(P)-dependent dehydrogenase (short-subunit alcohol dehydrogenase family)
MRFSGKTVLVTGAAGNLGHAVARAFAAQGACLILLERDGERQQGVARTSDPTEQLACLRVGADLLDAQDLGRAVHAGIARFGRIDVLCNLAGAFTMGEAVHETEPSTWDRLFDVNVKTVVHTCRAVVPHMLSHGGGKVINTGAYAAQRGAARMGPYIASKAALIRLTETMSAELREHGINVNCVLPTILDTPENRMSMPEADPKRWVSPAALAQVIVFLASEEASAIHGAALPVSGLS